MKTSGLATVMPFLILVMVSGCESNRKRDSITYALYSASLATVITYCRATQENLSNPQVRLCFDKAKGSLSAIGIDSMAVEISASCTEANLNSCITPKIGDLVNAIHTQLKISKVSSPVLLPITYSECTKKGEPFLINGKEYSAVDCKE